MSKNVWTSSSSTPLRTPCAQYVIVVFFIGLSLIFHVAARAHCERFPFPGDVLVITGASITSMATATNPAGPPLRVVITTPIGLKEMLEV
jgi:hypothetical protein